MDTKQVTKKKNSKGIVIGIIIAFVVVLALILVILISAVLVIASPKRRLNQQLNMGDKYITELDFDNAIIAYQKAIEIDPDSAKAYLGLAQTYEMAGDYECAIDTLREGYNVTQSEEIKLALNNFITIQSTMAAEEEENIENLDNVEVDESEINDTSSHSNFSTDYSADLSNAAVGSFVTFGLYEQDNNAMNGPEPIEWEVLDVQDGKALLVSRYVLDEVDYNEEYTNTTWETSSLRNWLNEDFYNIAFNSAERNKIESTYIVNEDNPYYEMEGGNNTNDRVFCLSLEEIRKYYDFDSWDENDMTGWCDNLIIAPTSYAVNQGVSENTITEEFYNLCLLNSNYSTDVVGKTGAEWWTRTIGEDNYCACHVQGDGLIGYYYCYEMNTINFGVRPALWVNIK